MTRRADAAGTRDRMEIVRHYILFEWNDSDDEIALAREVARRQELPVTIENLSHQAWSKGEPYAFRVGAMLRTPQGRKIREVGEAKLAAEGVRVGGSEAVTLAFTLPDEPGEHQLLVDVVEEGVCWFFERGSAPLVLPVRVE